MKIKLQEIRERKNLSKTQLSKISSVALGYISEIESGKYVNPSADILCKLSCALECKLDDLVDCGG